MQKKLSGFLIVVLVLQILTASIVVQAAALPYYNDFEGTLNANFNTDSLAVQACSTITADDIAGMNGANTKAMNIATKITDTTQSPQPYATINMNSRNTTAYLFKMKLSGTMGAGKSARQALLRGAGFFGLFKIDDTNLIFLDGAANSPATNNKLTYPNPFTYDQWHQIVMVTDFDNNLANIFVDGQPFEVNTPLLSTAVPNASGTSVGLRIQSLNTSKVLNSETKTYVDDVKIYKKTALNVTSLPSLNQLQVDPNATKTMTFTFNNDMDLSTLNSNNISLYKSVDGSDIQIPLSDADITTNVSSSQTVCTLALPQLNQGKTYRVKLGSAIKDIFGQAPATTLYQFTTLQTDNAFPDVVITSPQNNQRYYAGGGTVTISGTTFDSDDDSITGVQIYDGTTLLGNASVNTGTFTFDYINPTEGTHLLTAMATDSRGGVGGSNTAAVFVVSDILSYTINGASTNSDFFVPGQLAAKLKVNACQQSRMPVSVIIAQYKENKLMSVAVQKQEAIGNNEVVCNMNVTQAEGTDVKIFALNGLSDLKPIAKSIHLTPSTDGNIVNTPVKIYLVSDSICQNYDTAYSPQQGWGYYLQNYFKDGVTVDNHAVGGRSTKTFISEGRWDGNTGFLPGQTGVLKTIQRGDYVFFSMGHNDKNTSNPSVYTSIEEYKTNLRRYIDDTRAVKANIILITPITETWTSTPSNSLAERAAAMTAVANEKGVPLLDINAVTYQHFLDMGWTTAQDTYYLSHNYLVNTCGMTATQLSAHPNNQIKTNGQDLTHISGVGADYVAHTIADLLQQSNDPLARLLKPAGGE